MGFAFACLEMRARLTAALALTVTLAIVGARMAPEQPAATDQQPATGRSLTVLSVNIWSGNPAQAEAARRLATSGADVIAIQEPHGLKQVEAAVRRVYPYYAGCTPISDCGAVIVSRHPIRRFVVAPRVGGLSGRSEFGYVWAEIEAPGGPVRVASTHFDWPLPPARQTAQRAALIAALQRLGGTDILTGDFNLTSTSFALKRQDRTFAPLTRRTHGVRTFPAALPVLDLDHIYVAPAWRTVRVEAVAVPGSDHRTVRVVVDRP